MLAMIQDNGISRDYLNELKLINENFVGALSTMVANFPTLSNMTNVQKLFLSSDTEKLLDIADATCTELKDDFISITRMKKPKKY